VVGFDTFPEHAPVVSLHIGEQPEAPVSLAKVRARLVSRGYFEAHTYSFVDQKVQDQLNPDEESLALANPISADLTVMRNSLWPGLIKALAHNLNRQQDQVRLFETGVVFQQRQGELRQRTFVGGLACGFRRQRQWGEADQPVDFFDVKGDLEDLLNIGGCGPQFRFRPVAHPGLHPGQSAEICREGFEPGLLGALHPALCRRWKLATPPSAGISPSSWMKP